MTTTMTQAEKKLQHQREEEARQGQKERDRLEVEAVERELEATQAELAAVERELAAVEDRIFADNVHTFTLLFPGRQVALLTVYGAANQESARAIARAGFKHVHYEIKAGDHTEGQAVGFYSWSSSAAQEVSA